jgi:hypothetical protein
MTMRLNLGRGLFVLSLLGAGLMLSGCPTVSSPHDFASNGIGAQMEPLLKTVDRLHAQNPKNEPSRDDILKRRYVLPNGNAVYPFATNLKRCNLHWEVNPAGIIVGYRYEEVVKGGCNW